MNKEQLEFVAMLGQEFPTAKPKVLGEMAHRLMALARKAQKNAEDYCNLPNHQDQSNEIREAVLKVIEEHGLKSCLAPRVTGDPRGYCLKLHTPSGRYNTWGGKEEGYGVPC